MLNCSRAAATICMVFLVFLAGAIATFPEHVAARNAGIRLAVAADFAQVAKRLGGDFTQRHNIPVSIESASSGALASQIRSGKRFDVFLSANVSYPNSLVAEGLALPDTVFYAAGTIALFARGRDLSTDGQRLLTAGTFGRLAIADPKKAPYGVAAEQTLKSLSLWERLQGTLVFGRNIAETLALIMNGKADAGFVAFPDLAATQKSKAWLVPSQRHEPITQAAVALKSAQDPASAAQWMSYLTSKKARAIIQEAGFRLHR